MTVYINGNFIEDAPDKCLYKAYLEGQCNSLDMVFDDSEGNIRALNLSKGDTVQVLEGNVDTGEMYISGIDYSGSQAAVRALSLPLSAFKTDSAAWENASLTAVINDVLKDIGITPEFTDKPDFTYKEITRVEEEPLKFLASRLSLEGFGIRVNDGKAYIFDEKALEKQDYTMQLTEEDFESAPDYSTKDARLISRVENTYITGDGTEISTTEESGIEGKILRTSMAASTVGESIRLSQGIMRAANKYEYLAKGSMEELDHEPGEVLYLADAPKGHTGENIVYRVDSDIAGNRQTIYMRRPIEGDY
jgi:hypothetical protein